MGGISRSGDVDYGYRSPVWNVWQPAGIGVQVETMPRYHFDLIDSVVVEDLGGRLCEDDAHAVRAANDMASQLFENRPELHRKRYKVVVKDRDGRELHKAAVDRIAGLEFDSARMTAAKVSK